MYYDMVMGLRNITYVKVLLTSEMDITPSMEATIPSSSMLTLPAFNCAVECKRLHILLAVLCVMLCDMPHILEWSDKWQCLDYML